MGLVGNLEDLGLGDILQIVSLSKKSGVLLLTSGKREGTIVFIGGQVVRAVSSQFHANLGDILLKHKLLSPQTLEQALAEQEKNGHRPLGPLLVEKYAVAEEKIEAIIKAQIERVVYSFFGWKDGTFSFQLDEPEAIGSARLNPLDFMLEQGLSPQWLAVEGRRLASEGRLILSEKDEEARLEKSAAEPSTAPSQKVETIEAGPLFIIDDDGPTRSILAKAFVRAGFEVETFALTSDLIKACSERVQQGQRPALLIDLIMPRLDGNGILGGLEVMEVVAEKHADLPMMLMTDHPNAEAERRARELGGMAVLRKPKKLDIRDIKGLETLKNLLFEVDLRLAPAGSSGGHGKVYQIEKVLADAFDGGPRTIDSLPEGSPGLYLLKGMLQELANPLLGGGVILLTLRFASELLNRAVIFHVNEDEIVGLGQFGLDAMTENADRMVRKLRLKIDAESIFAQVLEHKNATKGRLGSCASDRKLQSRLGGREPSEVFIGPLVSDGKVVAILYGDNLPEAKSIGNVEAFEVFLSQAGMAMEELLLERAN